MTVTIPPVPLFADEALRFVRRPDGVLLIDYEVRQASGGAQLRIGSLTLQPAVLRLAADNPTAQQQLALWVREDLNVQRRARAEAGWDLPARQLGADPELHCLPLELTAAYPTCETVVFEHEGQLLLGVSLAGDPGDTGVREAGTFVAQAILDTLAPPARAQLVAQLQATMREQITGRGA